MTLKTTILDGSDWFRPVNRPSWSFFSGKMVYFVEFLREISRKLIYCKKWANYSFRNRRERKKRLFTPLMSKLNSLLTVISRKKEEKLKDKKVSENRGIPFENGLRWIQEQFTAHLSEYKDILKNCKKPKQKARCLDGENCWLWLRLLATEGMERGQHAHTHTCHHLFVSFGFV